MNKSWRPIWNCPGRGLALFTFGNASGIDRSRGLVAIKPSGVPYERMRAADLPIVDLDGKIVEGEMRPSSDLDTHLALYRVLRGDWRGDAHALPLGHHLGAGAPAYPMPWHHPCGLFPGEVPVTQELSDEEVHTEEASTGAAIIRALWRAVIPWRCPPCWWPGMAPLPGDGMPPKPLITPCSWKRWRRWRWATFGVNPDAVRIPQALMDRHFLRKHGAGAFYGQPGRSRRNSCMTKQPFGRTAAGEAAELYTVTNSSGMQASIATYGGAVVSLKTPDRAGSVADVVLGFNASAII